MKYYTMLDKQKKESSIYACKIKWKLLELINLSNEFQYFTLQTYLTHNIG